jgi:hypothetical protein
MSSFNLVLRLNYNLINLIKLFITQDVTAAKRYSIFLPNLEVGRGPPGPPYSFAHALAHQEVDVMKEVGDMASRLRCD